MAFEYDKIMRENLLVLSPAFLKAITGFENAETVPLPPKIRQTIVETETDVLYGIKVPGIKKFILHIEFQSTNDSRMVKRMAAYDFTVLLRYKMEVISIIIYIGKDKLSMKNTLLMGKSKYTCNIIDIRTLDSQVFIQSNNPGEVILGVLTGTDKEAKTPIIRKILIKLQQLLPHSNGELMERIKELEILSLLRNVNLQDLIIQEEQIMPIIIDIKEDRRYQQGEKEGEQRGELKGELKGKILTAEKMIKDGVPIPLIKKYTGLTSQQLKEIRSTV